MSDISTHYAQTDDDVIALHRFLCVVAGPRLPGKIDPQKSIEEVWRCVQQEIVLVAARNGELLGTLGLIRMKHWWGDVDFLGNRWFFTLPLSRAGKPLLREAKEIGKGMDMEVHIYAEDRGKIIILNRNKNRNAGNPYLEILQPKLANSPNTSTAFLQ